MKLKFYAFVVYNFEGIFGPITETGYITANVHKTGNLNPEQIVRVYIEGDKFIKKSVKDLTSIFPF